MNNSENIWSHIRFMVRPQDSRNTAPLRLLCRRHGADICLLPVWDAHHFTTKTDIFHLYLDNIQDRPLIIQFEASNVHHFIAAAQMVETNCDAVCLVLKHNEVSLRANTEEDSESRHLSTSQSIAIIEKASTILRAPIGLYIHVILNEQVAALDILKNCAKQSGVKFVILSFLSNGELLLENKSAMIAILKEVKGHTSLPIYFEAPLGNLSDAQDVIKETGINGYVATDSISYNPAFFSGKSDVLIWDLTSELLDICRQCTEVNLKSIKSHLFMIWHQCLSEVNWLKKELGCANSLDDLYDLNQKLKVELLKLQGEEDLNGSQMSSTSTTRQLMYSCYKPQETKSLTRNLKSTNGKLEDNDSSWASTSVLSRKEFRRQRHYLRVVQSKKQNRKLNKQRRKLKVPNHTITEGAAAVAESTLSKYQMKQEIRKKMEDAMTTGPRVCIDLSYTNLMSQKELNKLAAQLGRLYGSNRSSVKPVSLHFTSFSKSDALYQTCVRKNDGFDRYQVTMTDKSHSDLFAKEELVYLSPDSDNTLTSMDERKVYVIGGLVDETIHKNHSRSKADKEGVTTARLPIDQYLERTKDEGSFSQVLTVNQVFDVILTYHATNGNWTKALLAGVPKRKGYGCTCTDHNERAETANSQPFLQSPTKTQHPDSERH